MRITKPQDFAAGLFFSAVALGAYFTVPDAGVGDLAHLGPSGFPRITASALGIVGVVLMARGLCGRAGAVLAGGRSLFGMLMLLLASLAFGLTFERAGLFAASALAAWISSFAHPRSSRWEALALSFALALLISVIFVNGIGLQVDFWPSWSALTDGGR